jgi:hypothetical protein
VIWIRKNYLSVVCPVGFNSFALGQSFILVAAGRVTAARRGGVKCAISGGVPRLRINFSISQNVMSDGTDLYKNSKILESSLFVSQISLPSTLEE